VPAREGPRPTTAAEFRAAWADLERSWPTTIDRARALPADLVHERVTGEWSFVQTLRHLLFVTDAWGRHALLGEAAPYHPLDLPPSGMTNPALPHDLEARPALAEVLSLRSERVAVVRQLMAELTDESLEGSVRVRGAGYPRPGSYAVRRCALALVNEEWQHRRYAERDLSVLEQRAGGDGADPPDDPSSG
jgi:hypothetical protein